MNATDEKTRIRIRIPIRFRIRPKMSRLRNPQHCFKGNKFLNLPYRVPIYLLFLDEDNYSVDTDEAFLVKPVQTARKVSAVRCVAAPFISLDCFTYRCITPDVPDDTVEDSTRRYKKVQNGTGTVPYSTILFGTK